MKINGRVSIVMQQIMAMRASKQNAADSKAQNAPSSNANARNAGSGYDNDGDSDSGGGGGGGGETSAAQDGEQSGGINYAKLEAAVKAGVVKPAGAPRNREENNGNGDVNSRNVSTRQSEQAAKNGSASNVKQQADACEPQSSRSAGDAYTGSAKTEGQQSSYAKGELVDLSA